MAADPDRFKSTIVETLAKRAANQCSNPECLAITSGPAEDELKAIIVGEAAHIYGARAGSARYDAQMLSEERRSISNAIWLCRNCHKQIDADVDAFPAEMLFGWRNKHERFVSEKLGKANDTYRLDSVTQQIGRTGAETPRARQILIDKPRGWEFLFTAELLREKCSPIYHDIGR